MADYLVVDAHLHCYRTAEAGRLAMGLTPSYTSYTGTIEDALSAMKKSGMSKAIMVNTIPLAYMRDAAVRKLSPDLSPQQRQQAEAEIEKMLLERLARLNAWSCEVAKENPDLFATITLDPILSPESLRKEVEDKVKNEGAKALKLHPPIGRYYPNDERMGLAYEAAAALGIPIIFHCGPHPHPDDPKQAVEYSRPRHYEALLTSYPKLTVVMAHMGMGVGPDWAHLYKPYFQEAMAIAKKHYPNVYFDLSECVAEAMGGYGMPPEDIIALVRAIGAERVLFGTDFPWYEPTKVLQGVLKMDLTEQEKRLILGENAIRVFKLT
ncbi:MAG: amidohydrolase [Candidatus Tectomicrobia bacterium]|uniref:Amidohydrolase n=1 Tax=Tectimicrobiota bacterium TaxID=2528274 RepID=A0A933GMV1_UNCTE|nr:amidohydrolase [Candidatus Tectomicrobia bacterium]